MMSMFVDILSIFFSICYRVELLACLSNVVSISCRVNQLTCRTFGMSFLCRVDLMSVDVLSVSLYVVHFFIRRHSVQNKFSTRIMNNGVCFCVHGVNSDILKHSVAMSDPCENWESTPGLKLIVWESRDRMKVNFYAYCLLVWLPN